MSEQLFAAPKTIKVPGPDHPITIEHNPNRIVITTAGRVVGKPRVQSLVAEGSVDTIVKHFASLLGERGIRVNAVAPGVVETDMSSFTKTDTGRDFTLSIQALKRLAQPGDIGGAVAFLTSNDARWITGATIHVDGGSKL